MRPPKLQLLKLLLITKSIPKVNPNLRKRRLQSSKGPSRKPPPSQPRSKPRKSTRKRIANLTLTTTTRAHKPKFKLRRPTTHLMSPKMIATAVRMRNELS